MEVVSFKLQPLYCRRKNLRFSLDSALDGPQRQSGCGEDENLFLALVSLVTERYRIMLDLKDVA
jgi:hypothetical protein